MGAFRFTPPMLHCTLFSVTIQTDKGIEELHWELTIKKARRDLHCVLDALVVLHQGRFHSNVLLKHVQHILDADNEKDADINEEKKIRELKDNLLKLNNFLDCVLLHYSGFNNKLPSTLIKEIKQTTKKIYQVIKQLKSSPLENVIPPSMVTEEDVLCSVLGLNDDLAKRLKNLSEEMRQHKTDMYYLKYFMGDCKSPNVVDLHSKEAVQRGLQEMGFIENRSRVVAEWIAEQSYPEHRSLLAWAQIYIENLFKYDVFLSNQVSKFPFDEQCLDKWFLWNVEDDCKGKSGADKPQVYVINIYATKEKASEIVKDKIAEINPNGQLFYHGTDHQSVENILKCGIRLGKGSTNCDFSNGLGFYVANDFKYALEEHAMKSKFSALIMFNINKSDRKKKCLDLRKPDRYKDLKSVVDYFRSGEPRRHRLDQKLYQEITNSHGIIGPVSRDGEASSESMKKVMQICIRNEEFAEEVGSLSQIAGIIFLNIEDTRVAPR